MTEENNQTEIAFKLRPINYELNSIKQTDGCVLLSQGNTVVLASMKGPAEVKTQNLDIYKAFVEVFYRPRIGLPSLKDRMSESIIKGICEVAILTSMHPRTAVSIHIQEMEDSGGLDACAINATCIALLASGIEMQCTVGAVHCIIDKNSSIVIDPDKAQSEGALAYFTFAFDSIDKNLVAVRSSGRYSIADYNDCLLVSKVASEKIFYSFRQILKDLHIK